MFPAHLLVRGEGHADVTVRDFARAQAHHGGEDPAMPALSSAPSSVLPSVVIRVCPSMVQDREHRRQHFIADAQRDVAAAIVLSTICGLTCLPLETGEVSRWADKIDRRHRPK